MSARLFRTLSHADWMLRCQRMANLTLEATIDHGRITVAQPDKLPAKGKVLLTVLGFAEQNPDLEQIKSVLGKWKTDIDGAAYEREVRAEWDERERQQWGNR
jgi:hypothetical protein